MKQNIGIFIRNNEKYYSGGRYYSIILAQTLAESYNVYYVTDQIPVFLENFSDEKCIEIVKTHDYLFDLPKVKYDLIIVIPDLSLNSSFYYAINMLKFKLNIKTLLVSFETPNWFNLMVPSLKKNEKLWKNWKLMAKDSDVLCCTNIAIDYAKDFYIDVNVQNYISWHPSININVASKVKNMDIKKENQIIIISSINNFHKGFNDVEKLLVKELKGLTVVLVLGDYNNENLEYLYKKARKSDISLKILYQITDEKKFIEIKKSKLMVCLSRFEGYGFQPIESLYMETPCVAYDLPIYKETIGENIYVVKDFNVDIMIKKIKEILNNNKSSVNFNYKKDELNKKISNLIVNKGAQNSSFIMYLLNYFKYILENTKWRLLGAR